MRILISSILCQSGLMTHVRDLTSYLVAQDIDVFIAYKRVNYLNESLEAALVNLHGYSSYIVYDSTEELATFALENQCTIIHAHSHVTFLEATEVSKRLCIPLIVTLHSVYPWKRMFGSTLEEANKIIAVGPAQANSAREFGTKIEVIANGINTKYFVPKKMQIDQGQEINILWYGRVNGRLSRGLRTLDRLAPLLPDKIKLTGLGSTDYRPRNFPLIPWVDHPLPYLQQSQIVFAHGRSLREAMACGSVGMLLGYGYGGLVTAQRLQEGLILDAFPEYRLTRPRRYLLLRDILLLVNCLNLNQHREEARMLAEKHFTLEEMGQKVIKVYRDNLKKPL